MSNSPGAVPPQPPSFEKRLPIALGLMMVVLLASQYFFKPAPGPKPVEPANNKAASQVAKPPVSVPTSPGVPPAGVGGGQIQAGSVSTFTVDTDLYRVTFTNRGGAVTDWVLKKYQDDAGKPLELIDVSATNVPPVFAIEIQGQKPAFDPNTVLYSQKISDGGNTVEFEYSDGRTSIRKSFQFSKDSYRVSVKSVVLENNTPIPHLMLWRGGFGDQKVHAAASTQHTVHYDASASKLITKDAKDAKNGPFSETGNFTFGGLEDNFFAAVALPQENGQLEIRTYSDDVKVPGEDKPTPYVGTGISTGPQNDFSMFVGPKDIDVLRKVHPNLGTIIDWGFFGILAKPLFLSVNWVKDHWTNNYGWAIVVVTLIINLLLFPLRISSLKSARKMQKLQPQIKAINDKYKNVGLRDPKKAEQNQEVMDLYKREGVNPVGGCLPLLIQMPFLYAFYRCLSIAIELRHAPWLWVKDLSAPESLPIHLLPIILVVTQFFSQKMTPAAGIDPNQQKMMLIMPVMFGFMFYYLSSGLVLYYLTGNLVAIAFQLIINRFMPTPAGPPQKSPVKATVKR
ncbi:MAG TPA: membrane protein insertase YidC [Bryobacteraceae bacterium]|nr:membrane protein insertase YidC [Bryobacteraceae bacterium]